MGMDNEEFEFPDEKEAARAKPAEAELQIEVEDDTPPEDRNRQPMPKELVEQLDNDDLTEYSEKVKQKLQQMKKVYHDERREKEQALRERQEVERLAQQILEENKRLKAQYHEGEKTYATTAKAAADLAVESARREYKQAYEEGDADKLVAAQEKLNQAQIDQMRAKAFVPTPLQEEKFEVQQPRTPPAPRPDSRAQAWQERNSWFGTDDEMTSLALGLHNKLITERGAAYASTDEYYQKIDATMRLRFPEKFSAESTTTPPAERRTERPSAVVAPASRSTSSKKVVLKQSEVAIAKRLGLTPEQYAREKLSLNGGR